MSSLFKLAICFQLIFGLSMPSWAQNAPVRSTSTKLAEKKYEKDSDHKIFVGQLVRLDRNTAPVSTMPYYLFFMSQGKALGLPLEVHKKQEAQVKKLVGKSVRIEGNFVQKEFAMAEGEKTLDLIEIAAIEEIAFNSLQTKDANTSGATLAPKKVSQTDRPNRPTMSIPDGVANGVIFGAGALLIGTMLRDHLKK